MNEASAIVEAIAPHLKGIVLTPKEIWKFQQQIKTGDPDECWEWQGSKLLSGYGRTYVLRPEGQIWLRAHRVAFLIDGGTLTPGQPLVLHGCNNRLCCNRRHLRAGDHEENAGDRQLAGTTNRGERPPGKGVRKDGKPWRRFTEAEVIEMRGMYAKGISTPKLGVKYDVNAKVIGDIVFRRSWAHIP